MKTLTALFLLLPLTANAASLEFCAMYAETAGKIMTSRQLGASMITVMEIAKDDPLLTEMTKRAYKEPRWSTEENRQKAIQDFTNDFTSQCLEAGE